MENTNINYEEYIKDLSKKLGIAASDMFNYIDTPLESECDLLFQFFLPNFEYVLKPYNLKNAEFYFHFGKDINAQAQRIENNYVSRINIGTIMAFKKIFLERSDALSEVIVENGYHDLSSQLDVPIERLFFQLAAKFIYYHEIAHLIQFQKNGELNALEKPSDPNQFSIDRHAKELDADIFASIYVFKHIIKYWRKLPDGYRNQDSLKKLIAIGSAAAGSFLMLFMDFSGKMYYEAKTHPHSLLRSFTIANTMIDFALIELKHTGEAELNKSELIEACILFLDSLFPRIASEYKFDRLKEIFKGESEKISAYHSKLTNIIANDPTMAVQRRNATNK